MCSLTTECVLLLLNVFVERQNLVLWSLVLQRICLCTYNNSTWSGFAQGLGLVGQGLGLVGQGLGLVRQGLGLVVQQ